MSRYALAASLVAVLALAACSAAPIQPPPSASPNPPGPSAAPSVAPPAPTPPSVTPPPADPEPVSPAPATPKPAKPKPTPTPEPTFTAREQALVDGILRGAIDCYPVREDLPRRAVAGIECASDDPDVARIGFYRFANDTDMVQAYLARMKAEGVPLESGNCRDGEHEGSYIPGEFESRHGCFINADGFANYRETLAGPHVYIGILARDDNMPAVEEFAWWGSSDVPGYNTLWGDAD